MTIERMRADHLTDEEIEYEIGLRPTYTEHHQPEEGEAIASVLQQCLDRDAAERRELFALRVHRSDAELTTETKLYPRLLRYRSNSVKPTGIETWLYYHNCRVDWCIISGGYEEWNRRKREPI